MTVHNKGDIMNGKQLKEFAAQVHDDAVIEVRVHGYASRARDFDMQALYIFIWRPSVKETGAT